MSDFLHPDIIDVVVGGATFFLGFGLRRTKSKARSFGIFLQVSVFLIKIVHHYFSTHPEQRRKLDIKTERLLQNIFNAVDEERRQSLKTSKETGALG